MGGIEGGDREGVIEKTEGERIDLETAEVLNFMEGGEEDLPQHVHTPPTTFLSFHLHEGHPLFLEGKTKIVQHLFKA